MTTAVVNIYVLVEAISRNRLWIIYVKFNRRQYYEDSNWHPRSANFVVVVETLLQHWKNPHLFFFYGQNTHFFHQTVSKFSLCRLRYKKITNQKRHSSVFLRFVFVSTKLKHISIGNVYIDKYRALFVHRHPFVLIIIISLNIY